MNDDQLLNELRALLGEGPGEEAAPEEAAETRSEKQPEPVRKEKCRKEKAPLSKEKKIATGILWGIIPLLAAAAIWVFATFHIVDFRLYARNATEVDLRGEAVSLSHYDALAAKLPNAEIRWDVPFQGGILADDTTEVTVTTLSDEDVEALAHLEKLEKVNATECRDYSQLKALQQRMPDAEVSYNVHFSADTFPCDAEEVTLTGVAENDAYLLQYLPNLKTVLITGNVEHTYLDALQGMTTNLGAQFGFLLGEQTVLATDTQATVTGITDGELDLLPRLQELKELKLVNPVASAEKVQALEESCPELAVSLEVEIAGKTFSDEEELTEIDLSDVVITDLAAVETALAYLPDVEKVIFGVCGNDDPAWGNSKSKLAASPIENEDMAAYRDRVRDQYKVVWTVRLGPSIALRTDKDNFMPNHFGVGQLPDSYAYNLRYCEDMVCLDVGHMTLTDISFVEYMPKLKYLILAWTEVQYIEPIRSCKNLVFLELDNSCIRDISPLVDCTALEDLNIGNTFPDVTPLTQMPWLKNVYMIFGSQASAWKVSQALPDTNVVATGNATVGGNWRRLQNYYDMRDCLGMYYMN